MTKTASAKTTNPPNMFERAPDRFKKANPAPPYPSPAGVSDIISPVTGKDLDLGPKTNDFPDPVFEKAFNLSQRGSFAARVVEEKLREAEVLIQKHNDYGPENIAKSPGGPLNGLAVRLWDKIARLRNLSSNDRDIYFESLADTTLDIANYGTIATLVVEGDWPGA